MSRNTRARRSQQLLFGLLSLIVVVSMGLALVTVPSVTPVQPTATVAPIIIATVAPVVAPTASATPTPASTRTP
jgi:hypothetical protein